MSRPEQAIPQVPAVVAHSGPLPLVASPPPPPRHELDDAIRLPRDEATTAPPKQNRSAAP
jgi:hypothetical protein